MLTELANTGDNFAKAFNVFLTYPFVDEVVGRDPQVARNLHMGDYTNLSVKLDIDLPGGGGGPTLPVPTDLPSCIARRATCRRHRRSATLPDEPRLQGRGQDDPRRAQAPLAEELPGRADGHRSRRSASACGKLTSNAEPGRLPEHRSAAGGGPAAGGGADGGRRPTSLPPSPALPRPADGPHRRVAARGPTLGELMGVYNPVLVGLLVPGMVTR